MEETLIDEIEFAYRITRRLLSEVDAPMDFDEMRSTACLALCECKRRFDGSLGVSFKTFAYLRIRGAVLDELRNNIRRQSREKQLGSTACQSNGRCRDEIESFPSSLPSPLECYERGALKHFLERMVSRLSVNEREIIRLLYFSERTSKEAAKLLGGRSKSWISRYHREALASLQILLRSELAA